MAEVAACQEDAACGRTNRCSGVVVGERDTLASEAVNIGGFDFLLTVAAEFSVAEVIGQNENNVGLLLVRGGESCGREERKNPSHVGKLRHAEAGNEL